MLFEEAGQLMEPGYLPLETGYYRLPNGQMHVAVLTRMPGCKGEMVDWWYRYLPDSETYRMWYPESHLGLIWDSQRTSGQYIGSSYIISEKLGSDVLKLRIHFHDPSEFMDTSGFVEAGYGVVICANVYDFEKNPRGRIIQVVRDLSYGCEMRSRFWLFKASEREGGKWMNHYIEQMGNLADFLPGLYRKKIADNKHVAVGNHAI